MHIINVTAHILVSCVSNWHLTYMYSSILSILLYCWAQYCQEKWMSVMYHRPANKYDFGIFVRFFGEISPSVWQYDLTPKKYEFFILFFYENDPWIVLFTPKCKIMSPFAFRRRTKTLKKVAFYEFSKNLRKILRSLWAHSITTYP
jgi:hypothetical protein